MNNPFQPPSPGAAPAPAGGSPQGPIGTGTLDVARALRDAWQVMIANAGLVWVAFIVQMIVIFVSVLMCIVPSIVVVPVLSWGYTRLMIDAYDGNAELSTMFSGFQRIGDVWFRVVALMLVVGAIALAITGMLLGIVGVGYLAGEEMGAVASLLVVLPLTMVALVFALRLGFASPIVSDGPLGGMDAIARSWEASGPVWVSLILLALAEFGIMLGVSIGQSVITLPLTLLAGDSMVMQLAASGVSLVMSLIISPFTGAFTALASISAYRQVMGTTRHG